VKNDHWLISLTEHYFTAEMLAEAPAPTKQAQEKEATGSFPCTAPQQFPVA
jgi:hypothetical protein